MTNKVEEKDMAPEYDLSKGVRGKFFREGATLTLPDYAMPLKREDTGFYATLAKGRGGDSPELEECIWETVDKLILQPTDARRPGMLLGKIQSGKTRAFLGIIALAFDRGYEAAIVLTKGTKTLAKQTVQRIAADFESLHDDGLIGVHDIMALPNLSAYEINNQKPIFVVKKQAANMKRLLTLLNETRPELRAKKLLIVDDEADLASVRFVKRKGGDEIDQGRIADQIDEVRRTIPNASFLQVTATPYSLYLQPEDYEPVPGKNFTYEPKRPAFTVLLPVHAEYVGGDQYFGNFTENQPEFYLWRPVPDDELDALKHEDRRRIKQGETLTQGKIAVLRHAVVSFVTGAVTRRLMQEAEGAKRKNYALIVHIETAKKAHAWQHEIVDELIQALKEGITANSPEVDRLVADAIGDLSRSILAAKLPLPDETAILAGVRDAFTSGAVVTEQVNSDHQVEALLDANGQLRLRTPFNIFIGGQILDRGITIPNLIGFYYGRSPKRMQQDTVLQHSRMYGARPADDMAVTRLYTTHGNHEALKRIHEIDSALRYAFEVGAHQRGVAFVHRDAQKRVVPCAPGKILLSEITALKPGGRLLPVGFQSRAKTHVEKTIAEIDALVPPAATGTGNPVQVSLETAIQIIDLVEKTLDFDKQGYEFDWIAFKAAVEYYSRVAAPKEVQGKCFVLAETNRKLARVRTSGRFADNPDTKQQADAANEVGRRLPVLALLRQQGDKDQGWGGYPFWWPVLYAPTEVPPAVFASQLVDDAAVAAE